MAPLGSGFPLATLVTSQDAPKFHSAELGLRRLGACSSWAKRFRIAPSVICRSLSALGEAPGQRTRIGSQFNDPTALPSS